jgi:hypothetical protein
VRNLRGNLAAVRFWDAFDEAMEAQWMSVVIRPGVKWLSAFPSSGARCSFRSLLVNVPRTRRNRSRTCKRACTCGSAKRSAAAHNTTLGCFLLHRSDRLCPSVVRAQDPALAPASRRRRSHHPSPEYVGAPDVLLRRAAVRKRLKLTATRARDVHHNPNSHDKSLNWFGRIGDPPNESDH